ncbi:glucose-6-phosphate dehydrogenase [Chelatococcus reniformis]|uniref:Glucose-6-phosphate 1-dehydrogenase n=1 Tax=Chelatococcus reniformis TaxID=1494448 RepID=A0A916TZS4_9HYPH|nr:glucose-6-phosphate dehydrogenase [Chelatococcus reniformis]GGC54391.1 glucose-6-phosphate 1-dehydrogenase [Chelatococcus reniformis]
MIQTDTSGVRRPDPCCFVIFGATGDLTQRLLVPALYNLAATNLLPDHFAVIGVGRADLTSDDFRNGLVEALGKFATRPVDRELAKKLFNNLSYVQADPSLDGSFDTLCARLLDVEDRYRTQGNRIFYLATPPAGFAPIVKALGAAKLVGEEDGGPWRRVIVEKPFGTDLGSARALNGDLLSVLDEDQIYRMDHYLGKETVQNITMLRFANGVFEPLWNRNHIDHVQITVAETVNVERRGAFFDATGTLRDMVPNHLFQLLSLVAMEPPSRFEAGAVRAEKAEVLDAISHYTDEQALANSVRASYGAGTVNGETVVGYREAPDVSPTSTTETYVALKLHIDNWRWAGVPFYLRTGKALSARKSEVAIKFKAAPFSMFRETPVERLAQNFMVLGIQPDEGIRLHFNAKVPGPAIRIGGVDMRFKYADFFEAAPSTGYETLIYDCMIGDAMLFQRADAVEAGWCAVEPFQRVWRETKGAGLATYAAGTNGPSEADALLGRDGRSWRHL